MTVRILLRTPGRDDVVLTLQPGHYENALLGDPDEYTYPPHVGILLLEDSTGIVHDQRMHIDPQRPAHIEQRPLPLEGAP